MKSIIRYLFLIYLSCLNSSLYSITEISTDINIPFDLVKGLIVMEVEVDGVSGNYIFDTGADGVLLNSSDRRISSTHFSSLNGEVEAFETRIEDLRVGKFHKENIEAFFTDLKGIEDYIGITLNGILGCSFFIPNNVIIDFQKGILRISRRELKEDNMWQFNSLQFSFMAGVPVVEASINREKMLFILDSGATSHFIDNKLIERLSAYFSGTGEIVDIITTGNFSSSIEKVSLKELSLDKVKLSDEIFCPKNFDYLNDNLDKKVSGLLSLSALTKRFVTIDLKKNKIYF
jgi:predicted aspartyl protease